MAAQRSLPELLASFSLASSSSGSRLLDLPAEIRIKILTILLAGSGIAKLRLAKGKDEWHLSHSLHQHSGQMLRVSRQVYDEGLPILYGGNKFDFTVAGAGCHNNWGRLLKSAIGEANVKLIHHLIIKVDNIPRSAFTPEFPNLQSVELHMGYTTREGGNDVFEKVGAEGFQEEVERFMIPGDMEDIPGMLREDKGVRYSLVLDIYEQSDKPLKLYVVKGNLSLSGDGDNTEGVSNEWRGLHLAKVKVWRFEGAAAGGQWLAGNPGQTTCLSVCCADETTRVCAPAKLLVPEVPEVALHEGPST